MACALLEDTDVNYKVAWALAEIGDERARAPLIAALDDRDAHVRVAAIQALVSMNAIDALPKLRELLSDHAFPRSGDRGSVAETGRAAIARLQQVSRRKQ